MAHIHMSRYCPVCQAQRLCLREDTHHLGHFVGAVLTCGLWLPVWLLFIFVRMGMRPRCSVCGTKC